MPALSQTPQQTTTPVQSQTPQTGGGSRTPQSNSQTNEQLDAGSSWDDVLAGKSELKKGDKGEAVKTLQQKLSGAGFGVAVTGELGPTTQEKVTAFQKAHQIQQTGTVGKTTAAALDKAPTVGGAKPTFTANVYNDHMKKLPQMDLKPSSIQKGEVDAFLASWKKNAAKYKAVAAKVNLPAELIAAIHWREGSGDFSTYLHNGDPLGKKTVHVPKGILFYKWEDAAVHALTMDQFRSLAKDVNLTSGSKDMAAMATFSEFYNGTGYHNNGISSPYVYAGTDQYTKGKYIADGRFSWDHVDQQPGTMLLIQSLYNTEGKPKLSDVAASGGAGVATGQGTGQGPGVGTGTTSGPTPGPTTPGPTTPAPTGDRVVSWGDVMGGRAELKRGDSGEAVETAQRLLQRRGYIIDLDGDFGPATEAKVKKFQSLRRIQQTGRIGQTTARVLDPRSMNVDDESLRKNGVTPMVQTPSGATGGTTPTTAGGGQTPAGPTGGQTPVTGPTTAGPGTDVDTNKGQDTEKAIEGKLRDDAPKVTLKPEQIAEARAFNLKAHTVSMLNAMRNMLVKEGFLVGKTLTSQDLVNATPNLVVDDAFILAAARYQAFKQMKDPDGKIGNATFGHFQKAGFRYTVSGGDKPQKEKGADGKEKARTILPKGAPAEQVYDYFKGVVTGQGGIFNDKPGYVNLVGIRGGKYSEASGTITQTDNAFNQWNDTLVVLKTEANGKHTVKYYEGTTDPGMAYNGVATLTEGTHAFKYGYHSPASGTYRGLNAAYDGYSPVYRRGEGYFLGAGAGAGQWLNVHTTHGYNQGALGGPGGYSLGCAVVNGQDRYKDFIGEMGASNKAGQQLIYYTVISASRMEGFVVKQQKDVTKDAQQAS